MPKNNSFPIFRSVLYDMDQIYNGVLLNSSAELQSRPKVKV